MTTRHVTISWPYSEWPEPNQQVVVPGHGPVGVITAVHEFNGTIEADIDFDLALREQELRFSMVVPDEPAPEGQRCGRVTDYDDSIGGEGEITCGAHLVMADDNETAVCVRGHKWKHCDCGGPTCNGWLVAQ